MCILLGKNSAVFRDSCFSLHFLGVKNAKIDCCGENDFECIFDRFEVLVVIIWSSRLTSALLLMVDFLRIFKITHF